MNTTLERISKKDMYRILRQPCNPGPSADHIPVSVRDIPRFLGPIDLFLLMYNNRPSPSSWLRRPISAHTTPASRVRRVNLSSHFVIHPPPVILLLASAHDDILISSFGVRPFSVGLHLRLSVPIHTLEIRLFAKTQTWDLVSTYRVVP